MVWQPPPLLPGVFGKLMGREGGGGVVQCGGKREGQGGGWEANLNSVPFLTVGLLTAPPPASRSVSFPRDSYSLREKGGEGRTVVQSSPVRSSGP